MTGCSSRPVNVSSASPETPDRALSIHLQATCPVHLPRTCPPTRLPTLQMKLSIKSIPGSKLLAGASSLVGLKSLGRRFTADGSGSPSPAGARAGTAAASDTYNEDGDGHSPALVDQGEDEGAGGGAAAAASQALASTPSRSLKSGLVALHLKTMRSLRRHSHQHPLSSQSSPAAAPPSGLGLSEGALEGLVSAKGVDVPDGLNLARVAGKAATAAAAAATVGRGGGANGLGGGGRLAAGGGDAFLAPPPPRLAAAATERLPVAPVSAAKEAAAPGEQLESYATAPPPRAAAEVPGAVRRPTGDGAPPSLANGDAAPVSDCLSGPAAGLPPRPSQARSQPQLRSEPSASALPPRPSPSQAPPAWLQSPPQRRTLSVPSGARRHRSAQSLPADDPVFASASSSAAASSGGGAAPGAGIGGQERASASGAISSGGAGGASGGGSLRSTTSIFGFGAAAAAAVERRRSHQVVAGVEPLSPVAASLTSPEQSGGGGSGAGFGFGEGVGAGDLRGLSLVQQLMRSARVPASPGA